MNKMDRFNLFLRQLSQIFFLEKYSIPFEIILVISVIAIAFFMFGPNLNANWWIIDDHEIVNYIGPDNSFAYKEIFPTLISKTEINPESTLARFRPAYYFLRLLETRLWIHTGPMGWYYTRIFIFIFFIITIYFGFKILNGSLIGGALALFSSVGLFWGDIFARLGPSEAYCVLGTALFILGSILSVKKKDSIWVWILITIGVIISVGSKENMIFIFFPLLLIFSRYIYEKGSRKTTAWISVLICLGWTGWIVYNLISRLNKANTDIYSQSIDFSDRFPLLIKNLSDYWGIIGILLFLFFVGLFTFIFWKHNNPKKPALVLLIGSSGSIILLVSQIFFYNGQFTGRYLFPLFLVFPISASLSFFWIQQFIKQLDQIILKNIFSLFATLVLILSIKPSYWQVIHNQSLANVHSTYIFKEKVDELAAILLDNPKMGLIFYGSNPFDYEPIDSYGKFLRTKGVNNDFYVLRNPPDDFLNTYSDFAKRLEIELDSKSEFGYKDWTISPLIELDVNSHDCLMLILSNSIHAPISCNTVIDGNVLLPNKN